MMKVCIICPHQPGPLRLFETHAPIHSWPQWVNVLPDCIIGFGTEIEESPGSDVIDRLATRELFVVIGGTQALYVMQQLRNRFPGIPVAAIQDGNTAWGSPYMGTMSWHEQYPKLVEFYQTVDAIFSATRNAMGFYDLFNNNVRYIGLPYPEEYLEYTIPDDKREDDLLLLGCRHPAGADLMIGVQIAKRLGMRVMLPGDPAGQIKAMCDVFGVESERMKLGLDQVTWLKHVAKSKAALYLDGMGSVGRFVRDCAALRIPCVWNSRCDFAEQMEFLYARIDNPDYLPEMIVAYLEAIIEDWSNYADYQRQVLEDFNTPNSRARFEEACACLL